MANFRGVAAALRSVERFLNASFAEEDPVQDGGGGAANTRAVLVRTEDFDRSGADSIIQFPALSIFPYRVDVNHTMRAAWAAVGSQDGRAHLPVDIHVLLTAWAGDAEHQLRILGRTLQCLETTPILSGPLLDPTAEWAPNEGVQLLLEDMPIESLVRPFDALPTDYRLSIPYVARIVRIDGRRAAPDPPVVTAIIGVTPSLVP
jgi:hypothetical protein